MFKVAVTTLLLAANGALAAQTQIAVGVGCEKIQSCQNPLTCRTKTSYWLRNSLTVGAFDFYIEPDVTMSLNETTGEVTVSGKTTTSSLGLVDIARLNCSDQDSDYKNFKMNVPEATQISVKDLDRPSVCNSVWNGYQWIFVKIAKYGMFFNYEKTPFFSTSRETVSCR